MHSRRDDLAAAERRWRNKPLFSNRPRRSGRKLWAFSLVVLVLGGLLYIQQALSRPEASWTTNVAVAPKPMSVPCEGDGCSAERSIR